MAFADEPENLPFAGVRGEGVIGGWQEYLSPEEKDVFDKLGGPLNRRLGYTMP